MAIHAQKMFSRSSIGIHLVFVALLLSGCTPIEEDMPRELNELTANISGKIKPLPEFKPYTPATYSVEAMVDPFGVLKAQLAGKSDKEVLDKPDASRVRQPLEAFPIEAVQFSGTIVQKGVVHALITAEQNLYTVKLGEYVGQNYGRIVKISENELTLVEKVQEPGGDWIERVNTVSLVPK